MSFRTPFGDNTKDMWGLHAVFYVHHKIAYSVCPPVVLSVVTNITAHK